MKAADIRPLLGQFLYMWKCMELDALGQPSKQPTMSLRFDQVETFTPLPRCYDCMILAHRDQRAWLQHAPTSLVQKPRARPACLSAQHELCHAWDLHETCPQLYNTCIMSDVLWDWLTGSDCEMISKPQFMLSDQSGSSTNSGWTSCSIHLMPYIDAA